MKRLYGKTDVDELKPKPMYNADADLIINLSLIANGDISIVEAELKNNPQLLRSLKEVWKQVYNGDIELFITPSVQAELGFSSLAKIEYSDKMLSRDLGEIPLRTAKFILNFCTPHAEPKGEGFKDEIWAIAEQLCLKAGFNYLQEDGIMKPSKDVFNLAQSIYYGLPFLTCNAVHYVKNFTDRKGNVIDRIERIKEVTSSLGYVFEKEEEPYKHMLPVDVKTFFPKAMKIIPSQKFVENYYIVSQPKAISEDEVAERSRETFINHSTKFKRLESGENFIEVPQTMLVLINSEMSDANNIVPSFIYFTNILERKDAPYFVKNLGADMLFYSEDDVDENGNISVENYTKSVKIPRLGGKFDTSSEEYRLFNQMLSYYLKQEIDTETILSKETQVGVNSIEEKEE